MKKIGTYLWDHADDILILGLTIGSAASFGTGHYVAGAILALADAGFVYEEYKFKNRPSKPNHNYPDPRKILDGE